MIFSFDKVCWEKRPRALKKCNEIYYEANSEKLKKKQNNNEIMRVQGRLAYIASKKIDNFLISLFLISVYKKKENI